MGHCGQSTHKCVFGLLVISTLLLYILVIIGSLDGVPGIYIESITAKVGFHNVEVRIGYFGTCLFNTDRSGNSNSTCIAAWSDKSLLSKHISKDAKSSSAVALTKILEFTSNMQHQVFVGSPAFFPGAGMLFLASLLLLAALECVGGPKSCSRPKLVLVSNNITITAFWLAAAWSFASALVTIEVVLSQQEVVSLAGRTDISIEIGIAVQCLQWIAFFFTAFFAAGMTGLKMSRAKDIKSYGKIVPDHEMITAAVSPFAPRDCISRQPMTTSYGTALTELPDDDGEFLDQRPSLDSCTIPPVADQNYQAWTGQQHPENSMSSPEVHWAPTLPGTQNNFGASDMPFPLPMTPYQTDQRRQHNLYQPAFRILTPLPRQRSAQRHITPRLPTYPRPVAHSVVDMAQTPSLTFPSTLPHQQHQQAPHNHPTSTPSPRVYPTSSLQDEFDTSSPPTTLNYHLHNTSNIVSPSTPYPSDDLPPRYQSIPPERTRIPELN